MNIEYCIHSNTKIVFFNLFIFIRIGIFVFEYSIFLFLPSIFANIREYLNKNWFCIHSNRQNCFLNCIRITKIVFVIHSNNKILYSYSRLRVKQDPELQTQDPVKSHLQNVQQQLTIFLCFDCKHLYSIMKICIGKTAWANVNTKNWK